MVHLGEWLCIRFKAIVSPHPHGHAKRSHFGLSTSPTKTSCPAETSASKSSVEPTVVTPQKSSSGPGDSCGRRRTRSTSQPPQVHAIAAAPMANSHQACNQAPIAATDIPTSRRYAVLDQRWRSPRELSSEGSRRCGIDLGTLAGDRRDSRCQRLAALARDGSREG